MINAIIVTLASELSFLIGIGIGSFISIFPALLVTAVRGSGMLSSMRAFLQGAITGIVAGAVGIWVTVTLGRSLSVPDSWLFWIAIIPPIIGEFGHFLNRFSLRHRGKPDTGLFVPLGRLHMVAWEPFRKSINTLSLEVFRENDPKDIPFLSYQKTNWFIGRVILGFLFGVVISMWWLTSVLHISAFQ